MRAEFLKKESEKKEEYFTKAATWMDSMRNGTVLEDGRCLLDELSQAEQRELAENIMENLMPEIKMVAKFKKKRTGLDEYKAEELEAILVMKVFENFHKFNNVNHLNDKGKRYTISTFIENKAKEAMRDMIIQERNLPVNVIRNLRLINDVVLAVAEEACYAPLMRQGLDKSEQSRALVIKQNKVDFRIPEYRFPTIRICDFSVQEYSNSRVVV